MAGRRLALVASLATLAVMAAACGDEPSSFGAAHVESNVAHTRATPEEATSGSAIVRRVGGELYAPLATEAAEGNLAYSPLSITTALGMTRAGAKGDSADQLDALLGVGPDDDVHRSVNGADEAVRSLAGPVQLADGKTMDEIDISTANALWGQSGVTFQESFLDELRASYDASMWTADFENDPGRARAEINDWVKGHTGEQITDLLPDGSIDESTRLVLTNAIHFKAPWPEELDTYPAKPFTTASGEQVDAPMLGIDDQLPYVRGDGWQAVTVPYAGGTLGLTLIVPDEGMLRDVEGGLDDQLLLDATSGTPTAVNLRFPAFDIESRAKLRDALQSLGLTAPFTTDEDFQPMTLDPSAQPLRLDDVVHQATVAVDEHGTEAAAATGAVFNAVGQMIGEVDLTVDRPFLFVIHDLETKTPMFVGRIGNPTVR